MITDKLPMIKGLILDMDGVLWHDREPIGDLPRIFKKIRELDLRFVLTTNNSALTTLEYQQKLQGMGVQVETIQIATSAGAAFAYLISNYPTQNTIYIVGSPSFKADGNVRGFRVLSDQDDTTPADFVLVGLDVDLTYRTIDIAARKVRQGAHFIATNTDATYPTPRGLTPGAGTMVAAIQTSSGKQPLVIGKPAPFLYQLATQSMGLTPEEILCVGDRLNTDILGAQTGGFRSAFVLSGVNNEADLANWEPKPTLVAKDLTALIYD